MTRGLFAVLLFVSVAGCGRKFLTADPSGEVTRKLSDLAGLLAGQQLMAQTPVIGEQSAAEYYLLPDYYNLLSATDKNLYSWQKDIYEGQTGIPDWNIPYAQVYNCNVVLDELAKIVPSAANMREYNELYGRALFLRAYAFHNISQVFAKVYESDKADKEPGIVMPLRSDISTVPARSNMKDSYQKITADLIRAAGLLPDSVVNDSLQLPNKPAAYALLARVYLSKLDYDSALVYADSTLAYAKTLLNFNTLDLTNKFPVSGLNREIFYMSWLINTSNVIQGRVIPGCIIDSVLYKSYENNDLRKSAFFMLSAGLPVFKANYTGRSFAFSGLALDETLLIRAECRARKGNVQGAMNDINYLLTNRYKEGTFNTYTANGITEALEIIWKERRKELVFRGLRWPDLKRLNKEFPSITLSRKVNGISYKLLPGSNRYVLPIPDDVIKGTSILQNNRD